jgi:hypothetical protein
MAAHAVTPTGQRKRLIDPHFTEEDVKKRTT